MRQIDTDELASRMARAPGAGITLVDVREPTEFFGGHVPGSVNIPMSRLPARTSDIARDAPVYVICRSGNRSAAMVALLAGQGFEAFNVEGGTDAWIASGRPVDN